MFFFFFSEEKHVHPDQVNVFAAAAASSAPGGPGYDSDTSYTTTDFSSDGEIQA